jgi:hypothetical protein
MIKEKEGLRLGVGAVKKCNQQKKSNAQPGWCRSCVGKGGANFLKLS